MNIEPVIKAEQSVSLALDDLREAHKAACRANPALALLLTDRIAEAAALHALLAPLVNTLSDAEKGREELA